MAIKTYKIMKIKYSKVIQIYISDDYFVNYWYVVIQKAIMSYPWKSRTKSIGSISRNHIGNGNNYFPAGAQYFSDSLYSTKLWITLVYI